MSKDLQQPQQSEEVDLGQLFNLIGKAFDKLFNFINSVFKTIFSGVIFILKTIIDNFMLIVISMVIAAAIGYGLKKTKSKKYISEMLVKPYFDSKFQLVTNINYYNALIAESDYAQLGNLFKINEEDSKSLIGFEIDPGPETENDRILQFEKFIKEVDSVRAKDISMEDYLENRSVYSGEVFQIKVKSYKKNIFRSLEAGLNSTFTNTYSVKKMQKRDSLISLEKRRVLASLIQVDSLKQAYIKVMQSESSSSNSPTTLKDGMSLVQERVKTREFELLTKELELRRELTELESQQVEEDVYFDTISSFQDVGSLHKTIYDKYTLLFPLLTFILLTFIFLAVRLVKYVKNYE